MIFGIIGNRLQLIVTAINQGCTNNITRIFLSFTIEREHDFCMIGMRIAGTIIVSDYKFSWLQFFMTQLSLCCPSTGKMTHPDISTTDRKHSRCEGSQGNSTLFTIQNLGPCLNHINIIVCTILQIYLYIIYRIFQMNGRNRSFSFVLHITARSHECS